MSWSSNNGDDSPWGRNAKEKSKSSYNGSGNNQGGDDFFDNFQDKLRGLFPKKNPASFSVILLIILSVWALSGFYRVGTDEQGVVTRFGEYVRTTEPGLHYHLLSRLKKPVNLKLQKLIELKLVLGTLNHNSVKTNKLDRFLRKLLCLLEMKIL